MSDPDDKKAFVARISLYAQLSKDKYRSFLQRNLRTVLDAHEERRPQEKKEVWKLFEKMAGERIWMAAFKAQKPVLSITGLHLRKGGEREGKRRARAATSDDEDEDEDGNPAWLPRNEETRLICQITVAVREPRPDRKPCYLDSLPATIVSRGRNSRNTTYEVRFHEPLEIEIEKLLAITPSGAEEGRWQRGLAEKYELEVGIHCHDSDDTAKFLSQIHGGDPKQYLSVLGSEGIIRACWDKLPALPQAETLLPLKRGRGSKTHELPFGVEIRMSWNEQVSPLVICNRALRLERGERVQLPTPASDDLEGTRQSVTVKYLFRQAFQTRTLLTRELKCILCERKPEHSSFERLHLHYITHHDHLQFDASNDPDIPDCKVFRIHIPEEKAFAREHELEPNESWEWQAPDQAFDIAAHLKGDMMWTNANVRQKSAIRATPRKDKTRRVASPSRSPLLLPARLKREMLSPEKVPNIPPKRVKRHRVPTVPNINFYRTTSKQQVEQGTEISDSDDEPDETWLLQTEHQHLLDLELDMFAVDFHELFNKHLSEERPMSDRLTREAVIRFARKFKGKLSDPAWSERFRAKLDQLKNGKVIGTDVGKYCMDMIAPPPGRPCTPEPQTEESGVFPDSPGAVRLDAPRPDKQKTRPGSPKDTCFGRRQIICVRPGATQSSGLIPIHTLAVKKDLQGKATDALQPTDLSYKELESILNSHLAYDQRQDEIWCSTNPRNHLVSPDAWQKTLTTAKNESKGPIRFELIDESTATQRLADEAAKRAKEKKNLCVCGDRVVAVRKTIACANPKCTRAFHMACVGMGERRILEWRCEDCS